MYSQETKRTVSHTLFNSPDILDGSIKFGLQHKQSGLILCYNGDISRLDECYSRKWLVDSAEHAEWVRQNPNINRRRKPSYDMPTHDLPADKLTVVKLTINVETNIDHVDVNIPSVEDFYKMKFQDDPQYLSYLLGQITSKTKYTWYMLKNMMDKH